MMKRIILINATEEEESRVALLDDGALQEFYIERPSAGTVLGNIYKGRVANIEPSIGAAFVEIGGSRNGFLHESDLNPSLFDKPKEDQKKKKKKAARTSKDEDAKKENSKAKSKGPNRINTLLKVGQELIVQVSKDGISDKGPTLTTYISLPGRFLVFMPGVTKQGISRKIDDETERERLKGLVSELVSEDGIGLIVRTAGANQLKKELQKDFRYLTNIWNDIQNKSLSLASPSPLYKENDLVIRVLRDIFSNEVSEVLVDSKNVYERAGEFMRAVLPRHVEKVRLYKGAKPLFDRYKLEKELASVLQPRIQLESGGSLFIEQTEALVAIDVNSGKFKGGELEETAFAINMEASQEIARQIRLRDLGGLIIVDFIDMLKAEHRRAVEKEFRDALRNDRARIKLARISPFGVIEVTRQRVRPSLESFVYEKCPHCKGTGFVATSETTSLNIVRKIRLWVMQHRGDTIRIRVNSRMAEYIQNSKRRLILSLEEKYRKKVMIISDPNLPLEGIHPDKEETHDKGQGRLFKDDARA